MSDFSGRFARLQRRYKSPCPTPEKNRYGTREKAVLGTLDIYKRQAKAGKRYVLYPYKCVCGKWHHTSQRPRKV